MSKAKAVFWVLVLAFFGVLIYQNQDFFLGQKSIRIINYASPALPTAVYFLIFFTFGLLITYCFNLAERFRLKKTIKKMSAALELQQPKDTSVQSAPKSAQSGTDSQKDSADRAV